MFMVGAPRSGTTWLRMLMAQDPRVSASRATHLYSDYFRSFIDSWKKFEGLKAGLAEILSEQEAFDWLADFSRFLFNRVAERKPGSRIILEKTPGHALHGAELLRLFPECYVIHVTRDPRAVAASLRAASTSWGASWAPGHVVDASAMWAEHVEKARAISALTARYYEVSYEHLHARSSAELVDLFHWLDEPLDPAQAEAYLASCAIDRVRSFPKSSRKYKRVDQSFFRRGEIDSWRRELRGSDIAIVERLTAKEMAALGYEPVSGRRARMAASARFRAYTSALQVERAAHGLTEWLRP